MIKHKSTFWLGVFILLSSSSFLGLPPFWKSTLIFISAIIIVFLSVKIKFVLPKRVIKRLPKKERPRVTPMTDIVMPPTESTTIPPEKLKFPKENLP